MNNNDISNNIIQNINYQNNYNTDNLISSVNNLNLLISSYKNNSFNCSILNSILNEKNNYNINNDDKHDDNIVISSSTIKRLVNDVKSIIKEPLINDGIYYKHDENNMLIGYAMIIGPKNTPYENGYYFFQFNYPTNYPFSPPIVKYYTNDYITRFNPNFYTNGKVCVSILNTWHGEQWTSCQTIRSILLTLCTLFTENPLLNEPGVLQNNNDVYPYTKIIEYKNIEFAIYKSLTYCSNKNNIFNMFYNDMKSIFLNNYDNIIKKIENKININEDIKTYNVKLYNMHISTNYSLLLKQIQDLKNTIK